MVAAVAWHAGRVSSWPRRQVQNGVELRTLLIPLGGSHRAESALPYAEALATPSHAHLVLVRAVPGFPFSAAGDDRSLADDAEQYLERVAASLDAKVGITVLIGDTAAVIAREARQRRADLIVMAIRARERLGGCLHGSVAEQVLARSPVPLLLVRAGHAWVRANALTGHPLVLVPLDGSPLAEAALPVAAGLAQTLRGELLLVRSSAPPLPLPNEVIGSDFHMPDRLSATVRTYLHQIADSVVRSYRIPRPQVEARTGTTAVVLAEAIHAHNVAVVVIATHSRVRGRNLLLENLADVLLRSEAVPLILVRRHAVNFAPVGILPAMPRIGGPGTDGRLRTSA